MFGKENLFSWKKNDCNTMPLNAEEFRRVITAIEKECDEPSRIYFAEQKEREINILTPEELMKSMGI